MAVTAVALLLLHASAAPGAPLLEVRPLSIIRPAGEVGWQADASAVLRGDLETTQPTAGAVRALVDRLSEAAAAGEARALSALGVVQLYGVVDSSRELELAPFHPLFNALRRFEFPPTLRPNATAAIALLSKAAELGEPSALTALGVLRGSSALADVYGDAAAELLPADATASTQLLARAAAAGDPVAASIMGLRASAEGECDAAAAIFEMGARSTIEHARAVGGSHALDGAMPNLARPSAARMRAGEAAELKAWADKAGKPPARETTDAALTYAQLCVEGARGLPRNLSVAQSYYERAAAAGEGGAHIALGLLQLHAGAAAGGAAGGGTGGGELGAAEVAAVRRAVEHLSTGIERSYSPIEKAMGWAALGQLALEGRPGAVPRSDAVALRCYREAAATGYLEGFFNLAAMHYSGRGVARDVGVAVALLAEAAGSGHLPSMQLLGAIIRRGEGVPRDCERAALLLRPVALRHEMVHGAEQAAVRSARRWDFARALLRSESLAMAGAPGALRRTAEVRADTAAVLRAFGPRDRSSTAVGPALASLPQPTLARARLLLTPLASRPAAPPARPTRGSRPSPSTGASARAPRASAPPRSRATSRRRARRSSAGARARAWPCLPPRASGGARRRRRRASSRRRRARCASRRARSTTR